MYYTWDICGIYVGYMWDICGIYMRFMRNINESCMGYFWIVWGDFFWVYAKKSRFYHLHQALNR